MHPTLPFQTGVEPAPLSEEELAGQSQQEVEYRITILQEEMNGMEVRAGEGRGCGGAGGWRRKGAGLGGACGSGCGGGIRVGDEQAPAAAAVDPSMPAHFRPRPLALALAPSSPAGGPGGH